MSFSAFCKLLSRLLISSSFFGRTGFNGDCIVRYREAYENGAVFPPIDVFKIDGKFYVADGFHRAHAASLSGRDSIEATIHEGDLRDAILFSVGANDTHGLARINDDKRNVVTRILQGEEWAAEFSDRNVAEIRKVSHTMVSNINKELSRLNPA